MISSTLSIEKSIFLEETREHFFFSLWTFFLFVLALKSEESRADVNGNRRHNLKFKSIDVNAIRQSIKLCRRATSTFRLDFVRFVVRLEPNSISSVLIAVSIVVMFKLSTYNFVPL